MPNEKINNGGPAFPVFPPNDEYLSYTQRQGMTLRDYFAAAALNQRKSLSYGGYYAADAAREAFEIADAMLKERARASR